jgi:hypothetical protein
MLQDLSLYSYIGRRARLFSLVSIHEGHADELELLCVVWGVDEEDLVGRLVEVEGGVDAVDDGGLLAAGREGLEVLEEAGLSGADEGREARDARVVWGAVVHDALLEREGGAGEDVLDGARGVAPPLDVGLVVLVMSRMWESSLTFSMTSSLAKTVSHSRKRRPLGACCVSEYLRQ